MSTEGSGYRLGIPPTHQADAVLIQANPVSGTIYTVLNTTKNVRLLSIASYVEWTVQPNPLQIWLDIDGQEYCFQQANPVSVTFYIPILDQRYDWTIAGVPGDCTTDGSISGLRDNSFMLEGKSVRVRVETTGGTVQNLYCRVKYAKW